VLVVAGALAVMALAACTAARDSPTVTAPSVASSSVAPSAPSTSVATASTRAAARELARFDAANRSTLQRNRAAGGRAFIDGLVAAGFVKADLQVTEDRTTIGLAVPSVQFSVLWRGVCLIGQHGPASGGYHSTIGEPVDGRCLIGRTRAIDW
jgi:hypothetical protein